MSIRTAMKGSNKGAMILCAVSLGLILLSGFGYWIVAKSLNSSAHKTTEERLAPNSGLEAERERLEKLAKERVEEANKRGVVSKAKQVFKEFGKWSSDGRSRTASRGNLRIEQTDSTNNRQPIDTGEIVIYYKDQKVMRFLSKREPVGYYIFESYDLSVYRPGAWLEELDKIYGETEILKNTRRKERLKKEIEDLKKRYDLE